MLRLLPPVYVAFALGMREIERSMLVQRCSLHCFAQSDYLIEKGLMKENRVG